MICARRRLECYSTHRARILPWLLSGWGHQKEPWLPTDHSRRQKHTEQAQGSSLPPFPPPATLFFSSVCSLPTATSQATAPEALHWKAPQLKFTVPSELIEDRQVSVTAFLWPPICFNAVQSVHWGLTELKKSRPRRTSFATETAHSRTELSAERGAGEGNFTNSFQCQVLNFAVAVLYTEVLFHALYIFHFHTESAWNCAYYSWRAGEDGWNTKNCIWKCTFTTAYQCWTYIILSCKVFAMKLVVTQIRVLLLARFFFFQPATLLYYLMSILMFLKDKAKTLYRNFMHPSLGLNGTEFSPHSKISHTF